MKRKVCLLMALFFAFSLFHMLPARAEEEQVQVESLVVEDVTLEFGWENDGESSLEPTQLTLTLSDGGEFSGTFSEVNTSLSEEEYDIQLSLNLPDADYSEIGEHTAIVEVYSSTSEEALFEQEYTITVLSPIERVEIEPLHVYAGTVFGLEPEQMTVTMSDGAVFSGDLWEVRDNVWNHCNIEIGCNVSPQEDPTPSTWEVGTHTAILQAGNKKWDYEIIVDPYPIVGIQLNLNPVVVTEGVNLYEGYDDEYGYYQYYDLPYDSVTVKLADGREITRSSIHDVNVVLEDEGVSIEYPDITGPQLDYYKENGHPWTTGNYSVNLVSGPFQAYWEVVVNPFPVKAVTAEPVTVFEGDTYENSYYDGDKEIKFDFYYCDPSQVTVTMTDGEEIKGYPWEVRDQLWDRYDLGLSPDIWSPQVEYHKANGKSWEAGTYQAFLIVGPVKGAYDVIVKPHPVKSITAEPVYRLDVDAYEDTYYDEDEGKYVQYLRYSTEPHQVIVTTVDGDTFEGYIGDVHRQLRNKYGDGINLHISDSQVKDHKATGKSWGVGTHKALIYSGATKAEYDVIIVENPIVSVTAEKVLVVDGTQRETYHYDYDTGEELTYQVFDNIYPQKWVVTMKDGTVFTGDENYVSRKIRENYDIFNEIGLYSSAYPDNAQWEAYKAGKPWTQGGSYKVELYIGNVKGEYEVQVVGIEKVEVAPITRLKGSEGNYPYYDEESGDYLGTYPHFDTTPDTLSVIFTDGTELSGNYSVVSRRLSEEYNVYPRVSDTQKEDHIAGNTWDVGKHEAKLHLLDKTVPFDVIITGLEKLDAKPVTLMEGTQGTGTYYDRTEGKYKEFPQYPAKPRQITIDLADGRALTGNFEEIQEQLSNEFKIDSYQTDDQAEDFRNGNPWKAGKYKGRIGLYLNNFEEVLYDILIVPFAIKSIDVEPITWKEGEQKEASYYDMASGSNKTYPAYDTTPQKVKVNLTDGKVLEGTLAEVDKALYDMFGINLVLRDSQKDDYLSGNAWGAGTHGAFVSIGSVVGKYDVIVEAKPTEPSEEPGESSEQPGESSEQPGESSEQPGESSEKPAESSEKPAESSEKPAESSEKPAESSEQPGESSEKPAESSEKPAESSEKPAESSEQPGEAATEAPVATEPAAPATEAPVATEPAKEAPVATEPAAPAAQPATVQPSVPDTGDTASLGLWVMTLVGSLGGALFIKKRK